MYKKSLKLNAVMNAFLTLSSFVFPLITFPYISRILLPTGTGKVALATSIISYFTMFAQLGIPVYGIRACAKVREDRDALTRTAQELLIINLLTSVVVYIWLYIGIAFVPKLQEEKALYIIVRSTILLTAIGMEWLYKALEQYTYITVRSVVFKVAAVIMMFLLIHQESDYVIYGFVSIFAASASQILNLINVHKYISLKPVWNYDFRRHIKAVAVFFAMSCATTVYTHLDTVMLGFMKTDADVGYYQAAVKIKVILVHIVTSLGAVLLPRSTYYIEQGKLMEFKRITSKAVHFVILIAVPLAVYFTMFARNAVLLLSGPAYVPAVMPMMIIMPTLLFIGLSNILGMQMLVPQGKEKIVLYSEIVGAVVDLVLNVCLIPHFTFVGAAVGTLVAEMVVLGVQYAFMRADIQDAFREVQYLKILIALAAGILGALFISALKLGNFLTLLFSSILFFGLYVVMLFLAKEPMVKELLGQVWEKVTSES